jgi:ubiquinone/menaquinone biosynthesis C-methylase UbiE
MSGNINIQGYYETVNEPWGKLFYKLVWHNIDCEGKSILDFGSGFGVTADYFAKNNEVTAIEPDEGLLKYRYSNNEYRQIIGGVEQLKKIPEQSFDMVICHNVLEYLDKRTELLCEFSRILKPHGILSIVKHNRAGKVMHKAVFEYKVKEAQELIKNGNDISENFGVINEYNNAELEEYIKGVFEIEKVYGIRMFFGLQRNELKMNPNWVSEMYNLECLVEEVTEFRNIASFHHVILKHVVY